MSRRFARATAALPVTHVNESLIYDWNRDADRPKQVAMLNDETLRDGLQSPSVRIPSIDEKIDLLQRMDALGMDTAPEDQIAVMAVRAAANQFGYLLGAALVQSGLLTEYQLSRVQAGTLHGLVLGPYRVLDRLGGGSVGVVFLGEHILLRRKAAIKVVPVDDGFPPAVLQRFYAEMRVLAELRHPHVVLAYDAGRLAGLPGAEERAPRGAPDRFSRGDEGFACGRHLDAAARHLVLQALAHLLGVEDVLDAVLQLVRKSLVMRIDVRHGTAVGQHHRLGVRPRRHAT